MLEAPRLIWSIRTPIDPPKLVTQRKAVYRGTSHTQSK